MSAKTYETTFVLYSTSSLLNAPFRKFLNAIFLMPIIKKFSVGMSDATKLNSYSADEVIATQRRCYEELPLVSSYYTSSKLNGNFLMRFPVRSKIALHKAGANGGKPGSPTPPARSLFSIMCTSISGMSVRRGIL